MKVAIVLFSAVLVAHLANGAIVEPSQPSQKVKLSLYYESLCPYCKKFITEQLGPNFAKFEDYLDVHLNPFGNAHMKKHGDSYKFTCQHGEGECKGSIMEGCLLNRLNKGTDNAAVPTIACIEKSHPEVASTTQKCMEDNEVTSPSFEDVNDCAQGDEGIQLFAQFGTATANLKPPHKYVPWIMFNDKWDEDIQNEAELNLPATLCRHFLRGADICKN